MADTRLKERSLFDPELSAEGCCVSAINALSAEDTAVTLQPACSRHSDKVVRIFFSSSMTNTRTLFWARLIRSDSMSLTVDFLTGACWVHQPVANAAFRPEKFFPGPGNFDLLAQVGHVNP